VSASSYGGKWLVRILQWKFKNIAVCIVSLCKFMPTYLSEHYLCNWFSAENKL
jgi:hypothetical protein